MFFLYRTFKSLLLKHPFVLCNQPTWRCDCKCRFCDVWKFNREQDVVLKPEEIENVLAQAKNAGFVFYTLWGGEPLLYPGIEQIVAFADRIGMKVILCTNGSRLSDLEKKFSSRLFNLLVSVEAVGEKHDEIRGRKGLFKKLVAGIEASKKSMKKGDITIWSNISRLNKDQIKELCRLAREMELFIEFFPTAHLPGFNDEIILDQKEREEVFQELIHLKRNKYPITNSYYSLDLMKSSRAFKCNIPRISVQMLWDGSLWPCEPRVLNPKVCYGMAREMDLTTIAGTPAFKRLSQELKNCNLCLVANAGHFADNLWVQGLRGILKKVYYHSQGII